MISGLKRTLGVLSAAFVATMALAGPAMATCVGKTAPDGSVIGYDGDDCTKSDKGHHQWDLSRKDGIYNDIDGWSDHISSMIVGNGVKVTLYWDDDFNGRSITLWPGAHPRFGTKDDGGWDNKVTSMKLETFDVGTEGKVALFMEDSGIDRDTHAHHLGVGEYNFKDERWDLLVTGSVVGADDWPKAIHMDKNMKVTLYKTYDQKDEDPEVITTGDAAETVKLTPIGYGKSLRSIKVERIEPAPVEEGGFKVVNVKGRWHRVDPEGCIGCSNLSYAITTGSEHSDEIGEETNFANEIGGSVSLTADASFKPLGLGTGLESTVTGSFSHTFGGADSIVSSFTTSEETSVTEECNLGAMWQWRTEAIRSCTNKETECDPFLGKGKTVCTTADAIAPHSDHVMRDMSWEGCPKVASSVDFEGEGPGLSGVLTILEPQYRCQWNFMTAFDGKAIETVALTANPSDCRARCSDMVGCRAWTLDEKDKQCTLHSLLGTQRHELDHSSGTILSPKKAADGPAPVATVKTASARPSENATYTVMLTSAGGGGVGVVKQVRSLTHLDLAQARTLVNGPLPAEMLTNIQKDHAEAVKKSLEYVGAAGTVVPTAAAGTAVGYDSAKRRGEIRDLFTKDGCIGYRMIDELTKYTDIDPARDGAVLFDMITAGELGYGLSSGSPMVYKVEGCPGKGRMEIIPAKASAKALVKAVAKPAAEAVDDGAGYTVTLTGTGDHVAVAKALRADAGMSMREARKLLNALPGTVKEGLSRAEADALKDKLEAASASITLTPAGGATTPPVAEAKGKSRDEIATVFRDHGCEVPMDSSYLQDVGLDPKKDGGTLFEMISDGALALHNEALHLRSGC